jgi:hypothetical protein
VAGSERRKFNTAAVSRMTFERQGELTETSVEVEHKKVRAFEQIPEKIQRRGGATGPAPLRKRPAPLT